MESKLFRSFFIGGIEASTHRLRSGRRLDIIDSTEHTRFFRQDYSLLQSMGMQTLRSAIRWHLIETRPGHYDFSSVLPMVRAAREMKIQIIWDLCHYGWPDDLDIFRPEFVTRFTKLVSAFAQLLAAETDEIPFFCPINEISFFAWCGGDAAGLNPFARGRGPELKVQLARASIEAIEAIWQVLPQARITHIDPVIHIVADPERPEDVPGVEAYRLAQYEAWDMISGRKWPQIGGDPKYLDILGINYYWNNQWMHNGPTLDRFHPLYRRFYHIVREVYERYERPIFVAETGIEGDARPEWLRYVCGEIAEVIDAGVPVEGLCIYPIFNHPGWDDDRHCECGLWGYAGENGERPIYEPLAAEVRRQQRQFARAFTTRQPRVEAQYRTLPTANHPARICLFTDSLEPSGLGEHMLLLAEQLKERHTLWFVCPPGASGERFLQRAAQLGITTLPLAVCGDDRPAFEQFRDFLEKEAIDLVHVHAGIGWEGHQGIYAAHFAHVPVIVRTEHLPYLLTDPDEQRDYAKMIAYVDQVITVSERSRKSYIEQGVDANRVRAIANGVRRFSNVPIADRSALRQSLGLPENAYVVITVGRLTEQKAHTDLLAAIPQVLRQQPQALFVWLGDGPLKATLRDEINANGLSKQVLMLGTRKDVALFMQAADLLVMPSLFEGMPLVLLEAMTAGLPIVATRVGGNSEVIEDQVHGCLVPPANPPVLAHAIVDALAHPEQTERWRKAAQLRFESSFTVERMANAMDDLYRRLLRQAVPHGEQWTRRTSTLPAVTTYANGDQAGYDSTQP
ncbi:MAG: glycosyltransferase [Caldilineaceae bacterium]|nr:glycosyltransferase [Caldilineaceae bacterium]